MEIDTRRNYPSFSPKNVKFYIYGIRNYLTREARGNIFKDSQAS